MKVHNILISSLLVVLLLVITAAPTFADEPASEPKDAADATATEITSSAAEEAASTAGDDAAEESAFGVPEGLVALTKDSKLWIDPKRKYVVFDGKVVLREGQLEMFACPKGSKEHESVVAVDTKAQYVHAALLAVGTKPGSTVSWDPEYSPATGPVIDIYVLWKDEEGNNRRANAQQWIKHVKTGKPMPYDWVFAGSGFWKDPDTGVQYYYGDAGDFICVSNFATATLDLPIKSSQDNSDLLFTAFTENIPPIGTPVRLVLVPRPEEKPTVKAPESAESTGEPKREVESSAASTD